MNSGGSFFVEDAFGEIYEGTFFADDMKNFSSNSSKSAANKKEAAIYSATSQVRISTESEVLRESDRAFLTACNLDNSMLCGRPVHFVGKIFSDF